MSVLRDDLQSSLGAAYSLERELGGGGMSRVFTAHDNRLRRTVVVKVLHPELAAGLSVERFEREIMLAASLQHPQVVPVLSAGQVGGLPFYTMPFVDGESLRERLRRAASAGGATAGLPLAECVAILRDVARALAFAHDRGIVHRDIKPDNILLAGASAAVADFGIAKALSTSRLRSTETPVETLTQVGSSLGTPAYMAPEQALGSPDVDHRADIYAFGCVAYEMLAGRTLFGDRPVHGVIGAHITEAPVPVATWRPDVPRALADLVMQCLEKDPPRRPQTAVELLAVLDAAPDAPRAPARRRARAVAAAVGAAAVVVALGAYALHRSAARIDSLAVIPFTAVGGDTANEYFAEGIADELSTQLARVPGLSVAGKQSSLAYRGSTATPEEIGSALHVKTVLTGTVRRASGRVRVAAQLASTSNGRVLWTDSYERPFHDVFALQDDIGRAIVGALRQTLFGAPVLARAASGSPTPRPEAYDLYLRGMHLYHRRDQQRSLEYFARAVEVDSTYARAYAATALALASAASYLDVVPDIAVRTEQAASRAMHFDSSASDSHLATAMAMQVAHRWDAADAAFQRAIAADPRSSLAHSRYGRFLALSGADPARAIAAARHALELDPLDPNTAGLLALALLVDRQVGPALEAARRAYEINTGRGPSVESLQLAALLAGRVDEARAAVSPGADDPDWSPQPGGIPLYVLARTGDTATVRAFIRRMASSSQQRKWSWLTMAYLGLGDTARALDAFERSADILQAPISEMWRTPIFDEVRTSPRFAAAVRKYGLDPRGFGSRQ